MATGTRSKLQLPSRYPMYRDPYNDPSLQQPSPHTPQSAPVNSAVRDLHAATNSKLSDATAAIDAISPLIDSLKPEGDFQTGMVNCLRLLVGQLREIKYNHASLINQLNTRDKSVDLDISLIEKTVNKTDQYSRRAMITVTGLSKPTDHAETSHELSTKVAEVLSKSGQNVNTTDLIATHRNSRDTKTIRGKEVPPSITVKFANINLKDNVLRSYKNYDLTTKRQRDVRLYQSLTKHYSDLRRVILDFLNSDESDTSFGMSRCGKSAKWVTYQSPSSGFAVKLKSGEFMRGIHDWDDFMISFTNAVKSTST